MSACLAESTSVTAGNVARMLRALRAIQVSSPCSTILPSMRTSASSSPRTRHPACAPSSPSIRPRRGPGAGGCRFWHYRSSAEALTDALRLSRGMSYKNAMAGLPLGGGKAVVMIDAGHPKSPRLLEAFGRLVDSLEGRYITAEDVGATVADMEVVATQTPYVSGLPRTAVDADGNPAPKTALGVYLGIKAAVQFQLGRSSLRGVTVGVQGLGGVGYELVRPARGRRRQPARRRHPSGNGAARVQGIRCPRLAAERNPVRARRRAVALRARRRVRQQHHSASAGDYHCGRRQQPAGDGRGRGAPACGRRACMHRTM